MKKSTLLLIGFLIAVFFTANAQTVTVDFDKEADFTKYKTFEFLGWQDDSDQILNDLDKKRMHDAFKDEFDKRELTHVESDGDMAVLLAFHLFRLGLSSLLFGSRAQCLGECSSRCAYR